MKQPKTSKILEPLNNKQKEAVLENNRNLLIIAGAGSGKTKTITHKIAYILENGYALPYQILALTFTNKAAREMKDRISNIVGEQIRSIYIGTFHSIALRILRNEGFSYTVYDTKDQEVLIKEILKTYNIDKKKYPPKMFSAKISKYKLNLKKYAEISTSTPFEAMVQKVYREYEKKLQEAAAVDFDNIIIKTIEMLQNSEDIREKYSNRFKYIFIDEYQDTNYPQYIFVKLLHNSNNKICAVGDDDQSIYGFRGADVSNMLNFSKEYENCEIVKLEQNYRSSQKILNLANDVISKNSFRNKKELFSEKGGGRIELHELDSDTQEADFVAAKIKHLKDSGESLDNIAILYRTNVQSRILEEYLVKSNIPYKIIGSKKFFDRKEIKDTLSYLKLIQNNSDNVSFLRAIESHPRGIGKKLIEKIQHYAADNNVSYFNAADELTSSNSITKRQQAALKEFIESIQKIDRSKPAADLIDDAVDYSNYKKYLEESKEFGRIENIMELKNAAKDSNLEDFLESISLSDYSNELDNAQEALNLMTIHASKGLEFGSVFIVGMEEGIFPNPNLKETQLDMEEERRLFYVAITRAKENLFISYAKSRRSNNKINQNPPSRFLDDIDIESFKSDIQNRPKKVFKRGVQVKHKLYGKGVVLSAVETDIAMMLTINFYKDGIKKVLSKDRNLDFI